MESGEWKTELNRRSLLPFPPFPLPLLLIHFVPSTLAFPRLLPFNGELTGWSLADLGVLHV